MASSPRSCIICGKGGGVQLHLCIACDVALCSECDSVVHARCERQRDGKATLEDSRHWAASAFRVFVLIETTRDHAMHAYKQIDEGEKKCVWDGRLTA